MPNAASFIVYLTCYRLAVIAAGIICIVLGYKLFVRGVFPSRGESKTNSEELKAEFGNMRLTLINAAPGTAFALFGMTMIVAMSVVGGPKMTLELLGEGGGKAMLRGGDEISVFKKQAAEALSLLGEGKKQEALESTLRALRIQAPILNDFAWILYKNEIEPELAGNLANAAAILAPDDPHCRDTLVKVNDWTRDGTAFGGGEDR